ncbi:MAG: proton-conducting transporter membrane subunit [bacterium]|nr:proton-conducting transporter membrane subunit [bacterium]
MNGAAIPAVMAALPLAAGLACLALGRRRRACLALAFVVTAAVFALSLRLMGHGSFRILIAGEPPVPLAVADGLSRLVCLGIAFFGLVTAVYAAGFFGPWERLHVFCGFLLMTVGAGVAAALADNFVVLLAAWGFLGLTLYVMVGLGDGAAPAAKKTMIVVGGSDAFMVLGIGIVWILAGGGEGLSAIGWSGRRIPLDGGAAWAAYLCLAAAAFAKAGAMPLHTWVPDCAERAPIPVTAFLPASLDKLLGIYLLARISLSLFVMDAGMQLLLMAVGAATIVCAVMMAMVQHDMRRLLGYHAVSQVGYMVLGIGTGIPVGIAGGLFHMVNHCLYKTCLFFGAGAVGTRTGTYDLDRLGGLARTMPASFAACVVAALAISGVPPLNGFASKWMVYQGLIEAGRGGGAAWILWLAAAMFGSVLTLASFVKLLHATFLGPRSESLRRSGVRTSEVGFRMAAPALALALLCVLFGVFALPLPIRHLVEPALGTRIAFPGLWEPALATWLILAGILLGLLVCAALAVARPRESGTFIGGEETEPGMALSGVDFYETISEMGILRRLYGRASAGAFDAYDRGRDAVLAFSEALRRLHAGLLPVYLLWCCGGLLLLLVLLG